MKDCGWFHLRLLVSQNDLNYHKVASSRLPWLVAHSRIFRLYVKWNFDVYVLWPLVQIVQNWIVDLSTGLLVTLQCLTKSESTIFFCVLVWDHSFRKSASFIQFFTPPSVGIFFYRLSANYCKFQWNLTDAVQPAYLAFARPPYLIAFGSRH